MKTKNNIAIVIPVLRRGGGAEKIASWLSKELSQKGWNVHFITFSTRENEYDTGGIRHSLYSSYRRHSFLSLIIKARKISKICRENNVSKILAFTEEASAVNLLSKFFGFKGKVFIAVRNNPSVRGFFSRLFIKIFYRFAELVIANLRGMANILESEFNLKKVFVIYNPCDIDANRQKAKENLPKNINDFTRGKFIFLNIGRMIEQKGQKYLLRAFKEVSDKNPIAVLVILGSGVLEEELKEYATSLGIKNKILFAGILENVYPVIAKSDCFVFPSLWEGFPNVLIDALSLDKTVIFTDCDTGPRELLTKSVIPSHLTYPYFGGYGVLVKPSSRGAISSINNLLPEEKILADAMGDAMTTNCWNGRYISSSRAVEELDFRKIYSLWEDTLG